MTATTPDAAVLLSVDEMYRADRAAADAGVPSLELMEAAGTAIAREIRRRWRPRPVAVLCGPGNNGGDGFVVARLLAARGWPVRVGLLGARDRLKGDAAVNAGRWQGRVAPLDEGLLDGDPLVVDALFGAGLARAPEGAPAAMIEAINRRGLDCVAVDVPSGVHGDTGAVLELAPHCRVTVTFFRAKPGHWLFPGRELCGDLVVADIGIPPTVLLDIAPATSLNRPALWAERFPWPQPAGNKYDRGHAVVDGGAVMTGAARLAAIAARRIGAGLVTITAPPEAVAIYAGEHPGTIVMPAADDDAFADYVADPRRNAVLLGPGAGVGPGLRTRVLAALGMGKACVLDADGLTAFRDDPGALHAALHERAVLTPHEGEFSRVFDSAGDKLARCRAAATRSGAVVLLKGADTVIAAPDGRAAINAEAPPELATAGTGDVLSGMILGLLAQAMPAWDAACAATWLHGRIAGAHGPGLVAEDLPAGIAGALAMLKSEARAPLPAGGATAR
ncbi:MAG: NAD(P)H-hydrate dehydratase [Rhodospirillales bacterium]|nr:MAG: NAD(P)H-hydrate dehydratase [Rhodospirillales bacterium]